MCLGILDVTLLGNLLAPKGAFWAGEGAIVTSQGLGVIRAA